MKKTEPINIAILGFGNRAEGLASLAFHKLALQTQMHVVAVVDPQPTRRRRAAEMFGSEWKLSKLMPPQRIDTVGPVRLSDPLAWEDVGSQPSVPWFVSGAARAEGRDGILYFGKTLTVEARADYVLHLGRDGGARLFVDGRSVAAQSERRNPCTHDRTQARVNLSQGTHEIVIAFDTDHGNAEGICFSLEYTGDGGPVFPVECGREPESATVDEDTTVTVRKNLCAWNSGGEQVDHQTVIIQYEDGTTADFTLDCFSGEGRTLKITGSAGVVYATPASVKLFTYHPPRVEEFGPDRLPAHDGPHGGGDAALILDWLDAVATGKPTASATPHESAEAVALCVGAEVSMLQHRIVNMADLRKERPGQEAILHNPWNCG